MLDGAIRFFHYGGIFMYIISSVLFVAIGISVERYIFLQQASVSSRKLWDSTTQLVMAGKIEEALKGATESKALIGGILSYGLIKVKNHEERRSEIEIAMEEGLMEVIPAIEKRTHYISTFANVAMLLGLLGTVEGLITAFGAVATAEESEKSALLSAAIAAGMNATALGLGSAIPLLLLFSFLSSKAGELVNQFEMASVKFINLLSSADGDHAPRNDA